MGFTIKKEKPKEKSTCKSIYIKKDLASVLEKMALDNNTSFNNIVLSMIEYCLDDMRKESVKS